MKVFYIIGLVVLSFGTSVAQDIHFSQYFNAPLTTNPATTGLVDGSYRIGVNWRNQWFTVGDNGFFKSPFMTTSISADAPFKVGKNHIGAGIQFLNDQTGGNTFSGFSGLASISYILGLGKNRDHQLSFGLQGGYTHMMVKTNNLQFATQFVNNTFNETLNSNENFSRNNVGFINLNFGALWYGKINDALSMYLGGTFFNMSRPKQQLLANSKNQQFWRYNGHMGLDAKLGSSRKFHLMPSILYMHQGKTDQINSGLGLQYDFNEDASLMLGVHNRLAGLSAKFNPDAIIGLLGFAFKGFKMGVSYDYTISSLRTSGKAVGALELSLIYVGKVNQVGLDNQLICPRF